MSLKLIRDDQSSARIFGTFLKDDGSTLCQTLELPDRHNKNDVSCIPVGTFPMSFRPSSDHQGALMWHIDSVPGRLGILVHKGNTVADIKGCVAVGKDRDDDAITESQTAYDAFLEYMKPYETVGSSVTIKKCLRR